MNSYFLMMVGMAALISSCHSSESAVPGDSGTAVTPVTVTAVQRADISDSLELNASSAYLQNSYVKSIANGFVKSVKVRPGDYVAEGKNLFTIETKESSVIGNTIRDLDSNFTFNGIISIPAKGHGFVTQLNHQVGDYVLDGEQLAVISDRNSFVFLLNMPYENRKTVLNSKSVFISLPDGTRLPGRIGTVFPTVDSATQTQTVAIQVNSPVPIPQNLIGRVHILDHFRPQAQLLPRAAVLADETQTGFWIMKMIDSTTAIKVPVKVGLEYSGKMEITDPVFKAEDQILISGNYGLPDTAHVKIEKP